MMMRSCLRAVVGLCCVSWVLLSGCTVSMTAVPPVPRPLDVAETTVENFGDSITCGYYVPPDQGYADLFDSWLNIPAQNWCRSGDQAADLSRIWAPFHSSPTRNNRQLFTVMIGTNDAMRGSAPSQIQAYLAEVTAALAWLSIPDEDKVLGKTITPDTGTWTDDSGIGLMSTDAAAQLSFSVNQMVAGRNLYLVYHLWSPAYGVAGQATIAVDGKPVATVNEAGDAGRYMPTQNGTADTFAAQAVPLGAVGPHTVTFTSTGPPGSAVGLLWAGVAQQSYRTAEGAPRVMLAQIPNSPDPGIAASATLYNQQLIPLATALSADGMYIDVVPTGQILNGATDFHDLLHPNSLGHAKVAAAFETAF